MDDQNPYASPQSEEEPTDALIEGDASVVRDGKKLLVPEGAQLPTRCLSCNRPADHVFKAWASRSTGPGFLFRLVLVFAAIFSISFIREAVPAAYEPAVFPLMMVAIVSVSYLLRDRTFLSFRFYICRKHQAIRISAHTLLWLGVLLIVFDPLLQQVFPDTFTVDLFMGFFVLFLSGMMLARWSRIQIRPVMGRAHPYAFHGFGERYLNSFPSSGDP